MRKEWWDIRFRYLEQSTNPLKTGLHFKGYFSVLPTSLYSNTNIQQTMFLLQCHELETIILGNMVYYTFHKS